MPNPDIVQLKKIQFNENKDLLIAEYAQKTLGKSNSLSVEGRINELKGILNSINK